MLKFVETSVFTIECFINIRPTVPTKAVCLSTKDRSISSAGSNAQCTNVCHDRWWPMQGSMWVFGDARWQHIHQVNQLFSVNVRTLKTT